MPVKRNIRVPLAIFEIKITMQDFTQWKHVNVEKYYMEKRCLIY